MDNTLPRADETVICAGILVADIFVPPLPRLPAAGELLACDDFLIDSGGCAANTATSLVKLGVSASAVGKVGDDSFGRFIRDDLTRKGINTGSISRSNKNGTSKTVVLPVKGEDRRYVHTFGANVDFTTADIDHTMIDRARVLYVGGYLVLPGLKPEALEALFRYASERNVTTILDVVVPAGYNDRSALEVVLPAVDYFMPNDEEAFTLTGETDSRRQAEQFLKLGCANAMITRGRHGTLFMNRQETVEVPAYPVEAVDSSGAGDAFAAGFIAGLLEGWDIAQILRFASAVGASACTRLGCTAGVFTRAEALDFLAQTPLPNS